MESFRRPNRSDVHLTEKEEAKVEEEARRHFEDIAPKRHTKPQRSEYSPYYVDTLSGPNADGIPEYDTFQSLENDPQKLVYRGSQVPEEFVETEYYKDLNCVDRQHHTTGTGFIRMENGDGKSFSLAPDFLTNSHASCNGNPATNEWIPATAGKVTMDSEIPNRSDA